jgi:hypothetical protein
MSDLESKMKVNIESGPFLWVKSLIFSKGNYVLNPNQRTNEFNALVYLSCISLKKSKGIDAEKIDPFDLLKYTTQNLPTLVSYYAQIGLLKSGVTIDKDILDRVNLKIVNLNFSGMFETYITQLMSNNLVPFILDTSIDCFSFDMKVDPKFINELINEFIPFEYNVEVIKELAIGMNICGYNLVNLVSKKPHSEVWKASSGSRFLCLKLEPIDLSDKEVTNMTKSANYDKIIDYIKKNDREYINYTDLKDFPYKIDYFNINYYGPLKMKVKIMNWYNGPISNIIVEDKKKFLMAIGEIIFELHKRGIMYNNISPNHIVIKPSTNGEFITGTSSNYRLIDYKHLCKFKEPDNNQNGHYRSLALITGTGIVTPYDDIESLLYIFNDLISGKVTYSDLNDEANKKSQLTSLSNVVSDAIIALRNLRQQDPYINGLRNPEPYSEYINAIYKFGINGTKSITGIILDLLAKFNEVPEIDISLNQSDYALLKKIRTDLLSNPHFVNLTSNPTKMNEIALEIMNFMLNASEPLPESMVYISAYLA